MLLALFDSRRRGRHRCGAVVEPVSIPTEFEVLLRASNDPLRLAAAAHPARLEGRSLRLLSLLTAFERSSRPTEHEVRIG